MTTHEERIYELLADRATIGLAPGDEAELHELLAEPDAKDTVDVLGYDLAAAAVELAHTPDNEPLPLALRKRVQRDAREFFAPAAPAVDADEPLPAPLPFRRPERQAPSEPSVESSKPRHLDPIRFTGWLAAAALFMLVIFRGAPEAPPEISPESPPQAAAEPPLPPGDARSELLAAAGEEALRVPFTATEDPAAKDAGGDVVWSTAEQRGFLRFAGLPENVPSEWQYQLWIFDREQDERYPIDGGVFDVTGDEVVVPIDPKLEVAEPTLFAVTIEKPGGVVVSSRERLVLIAATG